MLSWINVHNFSKTEWNASIYFSKWQIHQFFPFKYINNRATYFLSEYFPCALREELVKIIIYLQERTKAQGGKKNQNKKQTQTTPPPNHKL